MIVQSGHKAISAEELAQKTGADKQLIGVNPYARWHFDLRLTDSWVGIVRLMRVLTAMGLCEEAKIDAQPEAYLENSKTKILIEEQGIYSFKTWFASFHQHQI